MLHRTSPLNFNARIALVVFEDPIGRLSAGVQLLDSLEEALNRLVVFLRCCFGGEVDDSIAWDAAGLIDAGVTRLAHLRGTCGDSDCEVVFEAVLGYAMCLTG